MAVWFFALLTVVVLYAVVKALRWAFAVDGRQRRDMERMWRELRGFLGNEERR